MENDRDVNIVRVLADVRRLGVAGKMAVFAATVQQLVATGLEPADLRRLMERSWSTDWQQLLPVAAPLVVTVCGIQRPGCQAPESNVPDGMAIEYARCIACDVAVRADELAAGALLKVRREPAPALEAVGL
jgi:hypothetical protein